MTTPLNRRAFSGALAGLAAAGTTLPLFGQESDKQSAPHPTGQDDPPRGPVEQEFERDYDPPSFKPSWKNPQLNRQMVQDFVIFCHSDPEMAKKLLEREPNLVNATMDWGNGDWETGLGGASHMGRRDIVELLLSQGARMDLFCSAMLGQLEIVKSMLEVQPALIDARGPHGFNLHFHAQVGGDDAAPVLEYLQSVKEVELRPIPWLQNKK